MDILEFPDVTDGLIVNAFDASKLNLVIAALIKAVTSHSTRLDAHDARLDSAEGRLTSHDENHGTSNEKIDVLETQASESSARLDEVNQHLNDDHSHNVENFRLIEEKLQKDNDRIEHLEKTAAELLAQTQSLVAEFAASQSNHEAFRARNDDRFTTIDENYEGVKSFIHQEFATKTAGLDEQRTELAAVRDTIEKHADALGQLKPSVPEAAARASLTASKELAKEARKLNGRIDELSTRVEQLAARAGGNPDAPDSARLDTDRSLSRRGGAGVEAWGSRAHDLANTLPSPRGAQSGDQSRLLISRNEDENQFEEVEYLKELRSPIVTRNGSLNGVHGQANGQPPSAFDEQARAKIAQVETDQQNLRDKVRVLSKQIEGKADIELVRKVEHQIDHIFLGGGGGGGGGDDSTAVGRAHFRCLACDSVTPWGAPPIRTSSSTQLIGRAQTLVGNDGGLYKGRESPIEALQRLKTEANTSRPSSSGSLRKSGGFKQT
eukprot:TRINITY_DN1764_c0_g1_i1.p1 TRINITY_DN1764_c0_g1~~TRINITY_DN1764_c0_g1_i1.p1  ORF type:complete len:514 (-),score=88.01 TRINITY_DN1764_c0_g1_i1:206-1687(-)